MNKLEKAFLVTAGLSLCLNSALWAQDPVAAPAGLGGRGGGAGRGPRVPPPVAWAPKPTTPTGWIAPSKPIWRLAEILAAHKGQADWTEAIVNDGYLHADYISMGLGGKTPRRFNADTREWWIIQDGQIRFTIEGQEPFVASKGYMVQVPYRNVYSMETVGDKPSLRFEVNIAGATKDYPIDEKPPAIPGMEFIKITIGGKGKYENGNIPYLDFNQIVDGKIRANNFVKDDRAVVNIIRGKGVPDPGPAANGHFHESSTEFWFIMEGKVRYAIETQPTFVADQGDVVYAPLRMWHLASLAGDGMSTRVPINGYVDLGHHYMAK
jgi:mannose-6-phosphate isomerase-like protein (cupin superfamily)